MKLLLLFGALCSSLQVQATTPTTDLPVVDLGYERHQAASYNSSGKYYDFTNIRFAAPPVGDLRFRAPQPPVRNRGQVQKGEGDPICAQANPAWSSIGAQFTVEYLQGQTAFNQSSFNTTPPAMPPADPRETEDCLFLDVVVPEDIFENAGEGAGAPVLVWIYGGGYVGGSKSDADGYNPSGILKRGSNRNAQGVIYVAMNYRLGAFGWLSGPTFQTDATPNAGLYDQRFALEWVQKHIHKFGGDASRVTVFGESAGGGSIMHQITAYGGKGGCVPFNQAILQSPGFLPIVSGQQQERTFESFLEYANVSSLDEARQLSSADAMKANAMQVYTSPYGQFFYGPAVDGDFSPALPGELLLHGKFHKDVKVMVGHNAMEGTTFTSPFIQNNSATRQFLSDAVPTVRAWPDVLDYILKDLYPAVFNGSQAMGYTSQVGRAIALTSELVFTCNTNYLDRAFQNETYAYFFTIPPSLHGQDVPYTFYNGVTSPMGVIAPEIAVAMQEYFTNFAMKGTPNGAGVPEFPMYGEDATVLNLNVSGITRQRDPTANRRCEWWQKGLYA